MQGAYATRRTQERNRITAPPTLGFDMSQALGYAATSPSTPLTPFSFERRSPGSLDVALDILYCGVCHSDLHTARNEWKNTVYPSVPGHEIVGRVLAVGAVSYTHLRAHEP